jgi:signal transduction histidine kinase
LVEICFIVPLIFRIEVRNERRREEKLYEGTILVLLATVNACQEAKSALLQWEMDHEEQEYSLVDPELIQLHENLNHVTQRHRIAKDAFENATQRLKNICVAAIKLKLHSSVFEEVLLKLQQIVKMLSKVQKVVAFSDMSFHNYIQLMRKLRYKLICIKIQEPQKKKWICSNGIYCSTK